MSQFLLLIWLTSLFTFCVSQSYWESAFPVGGRSCWVWDTHLIREMRAMVLPVATVAGSPPHMKSISSIFGLHLCKKMSVYHWPRLLQLGTHHHDKEWSLFWFSLACLAEHVASRTQTDYGHLNGRLRALWRGNNNFLLWTTYFSFSALWQELCQFSMGNAVETHHEN